MKEMKVMKEMKEMKEMNENGSSSARVWRSEKARKKYEKRKRRAQLAKKGYCNQDVQHAGAWFIGAAGTLLREMRLGLWIFLKKFFKNLKPFRQVGCP